MYSKSVDILYFVNIILYCLFQSIILTYLVTDHNFKQNKGFTLGVITINR